MSTNSQPEEPENLFAIYDPVNPPHYEGDLVARIVEHFELSPWLTQVVKYVLRSRKKNGIEDLEKAKWYLEREINVIKMKQKGIKNPFPIHDWNGESQ